MKGIVINLDSRPDKLERFRKNEFPFEVKRFPGCVATCGEDGCTQSHIQVISQQTEFPFVVFEDDCLLVQPWSVVEKAMTQLPNNWDALWLGGNVRKKLKRYSENLFRLNGAFALHAVIYNSKSMIDFIVKKHKTPTGINLDVFYRHMIQSRFKCFIIHPMVATQHEGISDISGLFIAHHPTFENSYNKYVHE